MRSAMRSAEPGAEPRPLRIWIDLSNSPHALLFAPIATALEERGHSVSVTARDNAQTIELARERWPSLDVIGSESPAGPARKAASLLGRVANLRRWAARRRPEVALSHNSYAQIVAARSLRVPTVTAMDFEHQPANHLAFRLADRVLLPAAVPPRVVRRQGARASKLWRYLGLKESIYLGAFNPDPAVVAKLGIERAEGDVLVVLRTPPSRAIYHRFDNPVFIPVLRALSEQPAVHSVVLARHREQREALGELALARCVIPERALDARSLMYTADLVVGAGGTMTREAALMGIPTVSLFAGRPPAVDASLEREGLLRRLSRPDQLGEVQPRTTEPVEVSELRERGRRLQEFFVAAVISSPRGG
jgi:uncharacterized protein